MFWRGVFREALADLYAVSLTDNGGISCYRVFFLSVCSTGHDRFDSSPEARALGYIPVLFSFY